jgi:hypothetical protein
VPLVRRGGWAHHMRRAVLDVSLDCRSLTAAERQREGRDE